MKRIISLLIISACLAGCKKDNTDDAGISSLSFGTHYGFCVGNCATFYQLKNGQLYPDTMDRFAKPLKFKPTPLSHEKYLIAKALVDSLPQYLINSADTTFGCPDCADQGGIYIEVVKNGQTLHWDIDNYINGVPGPVKTYALQVRGVLQKLQ